MTLPVSPVGDGPADADRTVELFVRSLSPSDDGGHAETVLRGLDAVEDDLDGHSVHVWGDAVGLDGPLAETDHAEFVLDRVSRFREWATAQGLDLVGYDTREVDCRFTDTQRRKLSLPAVALAEYHDGNLAAVTPCRTDEGLHRVADHLDDIRERAAEEPRVVPAD